MRKKARFKLPAFIMSAVLVLAVASVVLMLTDIGYMASRNNEETTTQESNQALSGKVDTPKTGEQTNEGTTEGTTPAPEATTPAPEQTSEEPAKTTEEPKTTEPPATTKAPEPTESTDVACYKGDVINAVAVAEDYYTMVVNQKYQLASDYKPANLVTYASNYQLDEECAKAIDKLLEDAKDEGLTMRVTSGYRTYKRQTTLYNNKVEAYTKQYPNLTEEQVKDKAKTIVAYPGTSEHQTGLAVDLTKDGSLEQSFGKTKEGKWLAEHCAEYGFILRYQKGKEHITGVVYEPWHIRYMGSKSLAQDIMDSGLTLEEYYQRELK